jgi:hypothetical protein
MLVRLAELTEDGRPAGDTTLHEAIGERHTRTPRVGDMPREPRTRLHRAAARTRPDARTSTWCSNLELDPDVPHRIPGGAGTGFLSMCSNLELDPDARTSTFDLVLDLDLMRALGVSLELGRLVGLDA